jgi:hypothetical protein
VSARERLLDPRWIRPAVAVSAVTIGILTVLLDGCPCPGHPEYAVTIPIAAGVMTVTWLVEAGGLRWPWVLSTGLTVLPVFWLM